MRRQLAVGLLSLLAAPFAASQQTTPPVAPPLPIAQPAAQTVYYAGPGVTAPELLPAKLIHAATGRCDKFDRTEMVRAVVDANGAPQNVFLLSPAGTDLDKTAINIAPPIVSSLEHTMAHR